MADRSLDAQFVDLLYTPTSEVLMVRLGELELRGILDGHDPLVVRDERGEDVQGGRLPGAGATRDQDIEMRLDARFQETRGLGGERAEIDQVLDGVRIARELSNGE